MIQETSFISYDVDVRAIEFVCCGTHTNSSPSHKSCRFIEIESRTEIVTLFRHEHDVWTQY